MDGLIVIFPQFLAQGNIMPAKICAENDPLCFLIGHTGDPDADGSDVILGQVQILQDFADAEGHVTDDILIGALREGLGAALSAAACPAPQACGENALRVEV